MQVWRRATVRHREEQAEDRRELLSSALKRLREGDEGAALASFAA